MKPNTQKLLTIDEVAEILRISKWTVYRLAERREIAHVKLGRRLLFTHHAIDRFIESCEMEVRE